MSQYSLPENVASHVDFVLNAPPPQRKGKVAPVSTVQEAGQANISQILTQLNNCKTLTTPICVRSLYGINYEPQATDRNSYGIGKITHLLVEYTLTRH